MVDNPESVIHEKLDADEKLIWTGQPAQGLRLQPADSFLIPFGLFWTVMAVSMVRTIINQPADPASQLVGLIVGTGFVLIGIYLLIARFWVDAAMRRKSFYGITDRRIVIVSGLFSQRVKSVTLRTLSDVTMTESRNGSGIITFGPTPPWYYYWYGAQWPGMQLCGTSAFESIDQVGEVYRIVMQAQRAAS
jgi:hypothetical protein